eukprot:m.179999 g.179999  ORF g.179999 m.179999 type:complete len:953 (+) comp15487_c1_seq1:243-3101(+)
MLPIYKPETARKYDGATKSMNAPHIFAIADQAFTGLMKTGKAQCAVVSGESGAGKTESAKHIISQIISLCHTGSEGKSLEDKIIKVNPLLEAFGNAKTVMNNNSSRFGKYTELKFDKRGAIEGAQISEYLLEKSRVVRQNEGERNFHVFYYMFASKHAANHGLRDVGSFGYFSSPSALPKSNQAMYQELAEALNVVSFSGDEIENIHAVLAGLLQFGNLLYDAVYGDRDPAQISSGPEVLTTACKLLGLDEAETLEGLLWENSTVRGEKIRKPYLVEKAYDVRDALVKTIYGRMFGWICSHVNEVLAPGLAFSNQVSTQKYQEIGILDIFGFENFARNSFEQLCINVTNEQLQNFFNKHIFENELAEYRKEGVDAAQVKYEDNGALLAMFMEKPIGIFSLLDEESRFPKATDATLVQKYNTQITQTTYYIKKRTNEPKFSVKHYAGLVEYDSEGFLEKNRDTLAGALVMCCERSTNGLVADIFNADISDTGAVLNSSRGPQIMKMQQQSSKKKTATISAQFTTSLAVLMKKMFACQAHFVRCIKPNTNQAARNFVPEFVNDQLRYTGMLETCRIRREGYSYRPNFELFMERFGLLAYGPMHDTADSTTCSKVMSVSGLKGWLIGRTKVFLKYWHVEKLDAQLQKFEDAAVILQKWAKGFLARRLKRRLLLKAKENDRLAFDFMATISGISDDIYRKLGVKNKEDADRKRKGISLKPATRKAPPPPVQKSEIELKREASINWYKEKESPRGAGTDPYGNFLPWFHGLINRKEAERLLEPRKVGCFLVRVSENRLGYTLSYRTKNRCKHFMVEQDNRGRYALVGVEKICHGLNELVNWFQRNRINEEGDMLREACGQEIIDGEEQCNYGELLPAGKSGIGGGITSYGDDVAPPPVRRTSKPGAAAVPASGTRIAGRAKRNSTEGAPPPVSRSSKPASSGGAPPPPVSRGNKPRF